MFSIVASFLAIFISILALKESIRSRKSSFRPLLIPGRIRTITSDDNLFACNIIYPIADPDEGKPVIAYFGIKNIGKGPANNVKVLNFRSIENSPQNFNVGSKVICIPEDIIIPFTIRIAIDDNMMEYYYKSFLTTIVYEDLFGKSFYLSVRIWINIEGVRIIEYTDVKNPHWKELGNVIWRDEEHNGYFDTREIERKLNNRKPE